MLIPEVQSAIDEIKHNYGDENVSVIEDGNGGAFVTVDGVPLAPSYEQGKTWFGFHVTCACPYADVYPHFVRGDLTRVDKQPFGSGFNAGQFFPPRGTAGIKDEDCRPAVQLSRRSNRRDSGSALETPLIKLQKVLRWLNFQ